ncbi:acyl-CoA thioesterase II [Kwoniella shandongensis]|uniref:Acyl-CoA thioesterase II n=1 Tax=Kwoniella shandongensis TaxID=1734106 RepID=A0A5M6C7J2_9TREE|nr:acyl-CoA thioesterase II [Kwoniella shandongensis]KAA5531108.1 acyl-CoA thioesterase II [Kwoniella shandongensis]
MSPTTSLTSLVVVHPHSSKPLTSLSRNLWVPSGARGVFGGQVIAQSLLAASSTISSPLGLHSTHCYFLLPAHAQPTIEYRVEKLRDGKSYASRLVRAWQGDREVFVLLASYTLPPTILPSGLGNRVAETENEAKDDGLKVSNSLRFSSPPSTTSSATVKNVTPASSPIEDRRTSKRESSSSNNNNPGFQEKYQVPFAEDLLPWEECEEEAVRWQKWMDERGDKFKGNTKTFLEEYIRERRESPVSIARALTREHDISANHHVRMSWLRARLDPSEKPNEETVKAMIAYMTDFQFIGTASRSVGLHQSSTPRLGMLASLDHSIHFYPFPSNFDPSAPLLHVMESQVVDVASGRGTVKGYVYTQDGVLVAVTSQEGVVRADLRGLEAKGLVEGGAVEDDESERKGKRKTVKAKL